jgi:hypothetical protein
MKNLNEPRRVDDNLQKTDVPAPPAVRSEAEVVSFHRRGAAESGTLLSEQQAEELRTKWNNIQANFVDQPRKAVEDADNLVAAAVKQIEDVFAAQRSDLEKKWQGGNDVSTEDLRVCLQRYRDFFDHLLSLKHGGM